jgi:hypothetical protein
MPGATEILVGLARTADGAFLLAVAWHVVLAVVVLAALVGWRPRRRLAATLLALPLLSVSVTAWAYGNPFNAVVFTALAVALAALGLRGPGGAVVPGPRWARALGAALLAFAWVYPHFLDGWPTVAYLAAAPVGVIPCPTLAMVSGFALLADLPGGRAWSWVLAAAACFYGVVGVLRLGVWLDVAIIAGAAAVAARATHA